MNTMYLGDDGYLDWAITGRDAQDLSTLTGTVSVYDSSGTALISAAAATMSGTALFPKASYLLLTGSGRSITAAGTYRVVLTVSYLGEVMSYQSTLTVRAKPS